MKTFFHISLSSLVYASCGVVVLLQ